MVEILTEILWILGPWTEYSPVIIGGRIGVLLVLVFRVIGRSPAQKAGAAWDNSFFDNCGSLVVQLFVGFIFGGLIANFFLGFTY